MSLKDDHVAHSTDRILNGTLVAVFFALSSVIVMMVALQSVAIIGLVAAFGGFGLAAKMAYRLDNNKPPLITPVSKIALFNINRKMKKAVPKKPLPVTELSNSPREIFDILKAISSEAYGVYCKLSYNIKERIKATNKAIEDVEKIISGLESNENPSIIISSRISAAQDVANQLRQQVVKLQSQLSEAEACYKQFDTDYSVYASSLLKDIELEKISSAFELTYDNEAAIKQNEVEIQQFHDMVLGMKARFEALSEMSEVTESISAFIKA